LAVDQINAAAGGGSTIAPIFEDDASVPQQGTNVYNKLINGDKVAIVIGPTLSNTAKITNPIAQQIGVPVLGVSNTAGGITEIGDFIFRNSLTEAVVIPNTMKVAKEKLGLKKVVLFYGNDDAFTKSGADVFRKVLQAEGIQILGEQTFAKGDRDFSPQLTQIKSQNPDAIVCSALVEEASGIVSQARQLGIPKTVRIIGGNGFNSPALIKNAGEASEGVIVGAAWNISSTSPLNVKFVDDYTKKYNRPPDQFAAQAFAGVHIAYQAAKAAGTADNRKAIRDAMVKIKALDTLLGKFSFTEGRDADHTPVVQEVKGGKFMVFGN
jgi:branched-chain amino acid transport system substrate-binding protein